jgi:hypothetical protein
MNYWFQGEWHQERKGSTTIIFFVVHGDLEDEKYGWLCPIANWYKYKSLCKY